MSASIASAGTKLGFEIARKVYVTWMGLPDRTPPEKLFDNFGLLERDGRRARRQYEQMAETVLDRLEPYLTVEYGGVEENEQAAAVATVVDVLRASPLPMRELVTNDLDPESLESHLRAAQRDLIRRAALSPAGRAVFDEVLRETTQYIVEISSRLPDFNRQVFAEILSRETTVLELVSEVLSRLPAPGAVLLDDDNEFELRYRRALVRQLDRLQLFGLTLEPNTRRYPLTVAYITLSTASRSQHADDPKSAGRSADDTALESVNETLKEHPHVLVTGEAGSGKTTLLQWLAVNTAREALPEDLASWNDLLPFFIQLRRYVGEGMPSPENFLKFTTPQLVGNMPQGFVHRQFQTNRALLLVDGLDEVPEVQRRGVAEWLEQLHETYPDVRMVLTSRPAALNAAVELPSVLHRAELQPMTVPDVHSFIEHWHEAAMIDLQDEEEIRTLIAYREQLKHLVSDTASVRALATSPLLCAMICALNRDRQTKVPRDRMELYRIALETLLDRRDVQRQVATEIPELSLREKELLLQDLAYWLIRNGQSDADKDAAKARMSHKLEFLPHVRSDTDSVFQHLLLRSGILREPVVGRVDFLHRTFQEYLAAREAVDGNDLPALVEHGHEDQWRELIVLASGHCTFRQREKLMRGLLDRGDAHPEHRHALHLLAVACLETASELDPDTRSRLATTLKGLVPPTNMSDAKALASAGDLAASSLGGFSRRKATTTAATVRSLGLIGSQTALQALVEYGKDPRVTVLRELMRAWRAFDISEFGERVLADVPLQDGALTITDPTLLRGLNHLKHLTRLTCEFQGNRLADLEELRDKTYITNLILIGNRQIRDLTPLTTLTRLVQLDLELCVAIETFEPLLQLRQLEWLDLSYTHIAHLGHAANLINLRVLLMRGVRSLASLSGIEGLQALEYLEVSDAPKLSALEPLNGLSISTLRLLGTAVETLDALPTLHGLRELHLAGEEVRDLGALGNCKQLRRVTLRELQAPGLGAALNELTDMESLDAYRCPALHTLDLSLARRLRFLSLSDVPLRTLGALPKKLTHLTLRRLDNLVSLGEWPAGLRSFQLGYCPALRESELARLQELEKAVMVIDPRMRDRVPQRLQNAPNIVWRRLA